MLEKRKTIALQEGFESKERRMSSEMQIEQREEEDEVEKMIEVDNEDTDVIYQ